MDLQQQVLRTDVAGMPLEWVGYQDAVRLIALSQVSYSLGRTLYRIHGGINALSGLQSVVDVNAIIGKVSGVYVYCASECQYQIVEASAAADGDAAPASDFMVIPAGIMTPIPVSFANDYEVDYKAVVKSYEPYIVRFRMMHAAFQILSNDLSSPLYVPLTMRGTVIMEEFFKTLFDFAVNGEHEKDLDRVLRDGDSVRVYPFVVGG